MLTLCVVLIAVAAVSGQQAGYPRHTSGIYDPYHPRHHHHDPPYTIPATRSHGGYLHNIVDEHPKPYSFRYSAHAENGIGHSSRQETADGSGRVEGSYSLSNDEGHSRVVHYVADEGGFRARVQTNEPGTGNQNPADVVMESLAPGTRPHVAYRAEQPVPIEIPVEGEIEHPVHPVRPLHNRGRYNPGHYNPGHYNPGHYNPHHNPHHVYD